GLPQLARRPVAQGAQDHGGYFLRAVFLIAELDLDVLAHLALDRLDGALGRQHPLVAGCLANQQLAILRQAHKRGQNRITVLGEAVRLTVADDGHLAVGGAQIDANDGFGHLVFLTKGCGSSGRSRPRPASESWSGNASLGEAKDPSTPQIPAAYFGN